jgi:hypothetical protein
MSASVARAAGEPVVGTKSLSKRAFNSLAVVTKQRSCGHRWRQIQGLLSLPLSAAESAAQPF